MRLLSRVAAFTAVVFGSLASAHAQLPDLNDLSWEERLALALLAERLGIDADIILGSRERYREDVFDLGPAFVLHREGRFPMNDVMYLRSRGMGWGEIAKALGMHPGTFNKLRKQGAFSDDFVWRSILEDDFRWNRNQIDQFRRDGADFDDIIAVAHIANVAGVRPDDVWQKSRGSRNWNSVRSSFKVKENDFKVRNKGNSKGSGKGNAVKSGKGSGKSGGGQGNSKSKGKGNGKGKGKGGGG